MGVSFLHIIHLFQSVIPASDPVNLTWLQLCKLFHFSLCSWHSSWYAAMLQGAMVRITQAVLIVPQTMVPTMSVRETTASFCIFLCPHQAATNHKDYQKAEMISIDQIKTSK